MYRPALYVFMAALISGLPATASAVICLAPEKNIERVADYYDSLIRALGEMKSGYDVMRAASPASTVDLFVAHKTMTQNYECAVKIMTPFGNSKDQHINESSQAFVKAVSMLTRLRNNSFEELKDTLDGKKSTEGEGTKAERKAEYTMQLEKAWMGLTAAVVYSTWAMTGGLPDETSKKPIKLTAKEHADVLKKIKSRFGTPKKESNVALESIVGQFREHIDHKWTFSAKPQ